MNDKRYNELMQIYFINEISEEEKIELENYLLENDAAKKQFEEMKKLQRSITSNKPLPLGDNVLEQSRQKLLISLRAEDQKAKGIEKFITSVKNYFFPNYRYALSAVFTLTVGLFLGYMLFSPSNSFTPQILEDQNQFDLDKIKSSGADIANIRFNEQFGENGNIEFSFNTIKPITYKGSINDEVTLKLLAMALISSDNPGVRLKSLNTIASQTTKNITPDSKVKSSMITAVKTDPNAAVRKEALNVLMKYPFENDIRDAFLFVLQNDRNSGMRVSAINALADLKQQGQSIDDEIKNVLNKQIESAEDNFVKMRAASLLQEVK